MIVTIDGPAGAGKSSIARLAAEQLDFAFLDTGALYRCVTYAALRADCNFRAPDQLLQVAENCDIRFRSDAVLLNGEDVSDAIRLPLVTQHIRFIADHPAIRERLNRIQRQLAQGNDIVTEGRDQGSEVFPDAACKIFLTASPEVRAQRRLEQLAAAGANVSHAEILADQNQRDLEDQLRPVGRLRAASDAVIVNTDGLEPEQVLQQVLEIVRAAIRREIR